MKKRILFLFTFGIIVINLYAQENNTELKTTIDRYFEETGGNAAIYSGKEHLAYPLFYEAHPFLVTSEYKEGSLSYDGVYYPSLLMRLDLYTSELVVQTPDKRHNVVVPYDKLAFITLHSYYIYYHYSDRRQGNPPDGYLLRLYANQDVSVLERPFSLLESQIDDKVVKYKFNTKSRFYILKDDVYYPVRSMAGVLNVFKPYNRQLKEYARKNKLSLKKDPQGVLVALAKQYEILK